MHDAKREKTARQDAAAFSHEREMQQLARRGPVGVTAASHMTRGSLATVRMAVLVDRDTDSPPFAK